VQVDSQPARDDDRRGDAVRLHGQPGQRIVVTLSLD
jgi:hypothetical protein